MRDRRETGGSAGTILSRITAAAVIFAGVACSSSTPAKDSRPLSEAAELPAFSFLLPAPFELDAAPARFSREQSLRLFSAPVLDPGAIEALAARYEQRSRELLAERRERLTRYVCDLTPDERTSALRRLEIRRQQQWNRWLNLQERYEASLRYRLSRDVHADDEIAQARLTTLLSARDAVRALQRERQQLVNESYGGLLAMIKNRGPGAPDDDVACDAPAPVPGAPQASGGAYSGTDGADAGLRPGQPTEYLYLPYYLALYRFLSLLRPEERARLLFALHSGETSDN